MIYKFLKYNNSFLKYHTLYRAKYDIVSTFWKSIIQNEIERATVNSGVANVSRVTSNNEFSGLFAVVLSPGTKEKSVHGQAVE